MRITIQTSLSKHEVWIAGKGNAVLYLRHRVYHGEQAGHRISDSESPHVGGYMDRTNGQDRVYCRSDENNTLLFSANSWIGLPLTPYSRTVREVMPSM